MRCPDHLGLVVAGNDALGRERVAQVRHLRGQEDAFLQVELKAMGGEALENWFQSHKAEFWRRRMDHQIIDVRQHVQQVGHGEVHEPAEVGRALAAAHGRAVELVLLPVDREGRVFARLLS